MQKSTIATLTVLILMTMTLSSTLVGMPVEEEPVRSLTEEDGVCTSDGDCPDGFICSSTGECVKPQTCDMDGDCSDGQICQDGVCIDNPDQEDGNGCESNEDCTDGQYCDENGECADDPTQDDSCTSDADCADGQICGAAGECIDAPDDSGNETDGNETDDGGDEPQYRNCIGSLEDKLEVDFKGLAVHVCDEETGEWVELEDTRPTSVEVGCDEEPTEEQLDASNFADLLNEHDEILIRDGDDTIRMRTVDVTDNLVTWIEGNAALENGSCPFPACRAWDAVDFEITPKSRVFLVDIENNHSRTEMMVVIHGQADRDENATQGRSNSSDFDYNDCNQCWRLSVYGGTSLNGSSVDIGLSMNDHGGGIVIMVGNGDVGALDGYTSSSNNTETQGRSNSSWRGSLLISLDIGLSAANGSTGVGIWIEDCGSVDCSAGFGAGEGSDGAVNWSFTISANYIKIGEYNGDGNGDGFDDIVVEWNGPKVHMNGTSVLRVSGGTSLNGSTVCCGAMYLHDFNRMVQIGMDENGNVTNVNFIKRDVESCPSDNMVGQFEWDRDSDEIRDNLDENEPEDESSNVLVAAGGVEVTTRDAAVAGVAAATTALLSAVIRRGGGRNTTLLDLDDGEINNVHIQSGEIYGGDYSD